MASKSLPASSVDEDALRDLEDAWLKNRYRGMDYPARGLLRSDYMGGKSSGALQSRDEFLKEMIRPIDPATNVSHSNRQFRRIGSVVLSSGVVDIVGPERSHQFRYLRVFHLVGGRLSLVASQSAIVC